MNETHRTNLLTACAFAREFIKLSDAEIRGAGGSMIVAREDAQRQLAAALRALEPYNPDINKPSTEPYPEVPYGPTGKRVCFDGIPSHPLIPAPGTEDFDDF